MNCSEVDCEKEATWKMGTWYACDEHIQKYLISPSDSVWGTAYRLDDKPTYAPELPVYTPGPWELRYDGLYSGEFPILWVTQGASGELYLGANEDDTHLIVHAPDLMETLKRIQVIIGSRGQTNKGIYVSMPAEYVGLIANLIRAAIAKAEGKT